jgi:hypothetical protein
MLSGMAIGIGVRTVFSHSGTAELISVGVLNSFSAGILVSCECAFRRYLNSQTAVHRVQVSRSGLHGGTVERSADVEASCRYGLECGRNGCDGGHW